MASLEELRGVREQRQRQLAAALLALAIQLHVPLPARRRNRLHATREEHISWRLLSQRNAPICAGLHMAFDASGCMSVSRSTQHACCPRPDDCTDQTVCSFYCWGKKDGPHLHGHGVSGEHAVPDAVCIARLEPAHRDTDQFAQRGLHKEMCIA